MRDMKSSVLCATESSVGGDFVLNKDESSAGTSTGTVARTTMSKPASPSNEDLAASPLASKLPPLTSMHTSFESSERDFPRKGSSGDPKELPVLQMDSCIVKNVFPSMNTANELFSPAGLYYQHSMPFQADDAQGKSCLQSHRISVAPAAHCSLVNNFESEQAQLSIAAPVYYAYRISTISASKWSVFCDSLASTKLTFDPNRVTNLFVDQGNAVALQSQTPTQIYLSSAFHRVDDLVSTKLTIFSLSAAPQWVHGLPVTISPTAFAKMSALEVLELHDIPLADQKFHLVLPPSIKKISITGCALEQFSIEMADGSPISSSAIVQVDLHTNALQDIPDFFYSLPSNVVNLDARLNKFSRIAVSESEEKTLSAWMQTGILQVDNIRSSGECTDGDVRTIRGLSQAFTVCMTSDSFTSGAKNEEFVLPSGTSNNTTSSASDPSSDEDGDAETSSNSTSSPTSSVPRNKLPAPSSPPLTQKDDTNSTTAAQTSDKDASDHSYPVVITVSLSCGILIALTIGYLFFRHRRLNESATASRVVSDGMEKPRRPQGSLWTSQGTGEFSSFMGNRNSCSGATECSMTTPPPELRLRDWLESGGENSFSLPATPIRGSYDTLKNSGGGYSNMSSPSDSVPMLAQGFIMSKSLQSLTGIASFCFDDPPEKPGVEDRLAARKKLRGVVEAILNGDDGNTQVTINDQVFECVGAIEETQYSFICKCHPVSDTSKNLWLKLFIEHDAIYAAKEYRVLQLLQREPKCAAYVPQLVDVQTHKRLNKVKCSALVMEMGSSTTFLHVVRGQMEKSSQLSVVHQLSRIVHALESLHSHNFIHGSLNMETIVVFDNKKLKFRDLEHATRFKGDVHGYTQASVEFLPPEMARNVLCDGFFDGSEGSMSAEPIAASYAFDIWSLGVIILKMYATGKHLDEFSGCDHPADVLLRLAQPNFHFERSIGLYVLHDDVKDLVRQCLQREPSSRPRIDAILRHPVFQAYEHELSLQAARPTVVSQRRGGGMNSASSGKMALSGGTPPSLWLFLPPKEIGLDNCLSIDDYVSQMKQLMDRKKPGDSEITFSLLFMCESTEGLDRLCECMSAYKSRLAVPLSLLSLVAPLVQETTLFLESKAVLSETHIADVSGLGKRQWSELMNFYRALEKLAIAPVGPFTEMMLKPLQELLATKDRASAQQVLDEVKCLVFSQEKREHVQSLLEIVATSGDNAQALSLKKEGSTPCWTVLRKCQLDGEASLDSTRWLCRDHLP